MTERAFLAVDPDDEILEDTNLPDDDEETEDDQGDYEEIENELNDSVYPDDGESTW